MRNWDVATKCLRMKENTIASYYYVRVFYKMRIGVKMVLNNMLCKNLRTNRGSVHVRYRTPFGIYAACRGGVLWPTIIARLLDIRDSVSLFLYTTSTLSRYVRV